MSRMMKTAAVALVLAMVAFGPTAAIAAPHQSPFATSAAGAKFGLFDLLMQILGISSKAPVQPVAPGSGGATISPEGAIWGGGCHAAGLC